MLSENVSCNDLESQLNIALTRSDLIVAQKKLDVLNYFHTDSKMNIVKHIFRNKTTKQKKNKKYNKTYRYIHIFVGIKLLTLFRNKLHLIYQTRNNQVKQ